MTTHDAKKMDGSNQMVNPANDPGIDVSHAQNIMQSSVHIDNGKNAVQIGSSGTSGSELLTNSAPKILLNYAPQIVSTYEPRIPPKPKSKYVSIAPKNTSNAAPSTVSNSTPRSVSNSAPRMLSMIYRPTFVSNAARKNSILGSSGSKDSQPELLIVKLEGNQTSEEFQNVVESETMQKTCSEFQHMQHDVEGTNIASLQQISETLGPKIVPNSVISLSQKNAQQDLDQSATGSNVHQGFKLFQGLNNKQVRSEPTEDVVASGATLNVQQNSLQSGTSSSAQPKLMITLRRDDLHQLMPKTVLNKKCGIVRNVSAQTDLSQANNDGSYCRIVRDVGSQTDDCSHAGGDGSDLAIMLGGSLKRWKMFMKRAGKTSHEKFASFLLYIYEMLLIIQLRKRFNINCTQMSVEDMEGTHSAMESRETVKDSQGDLVTGASTAKVDDTTSMLHMWLQRAMNKQALSGNEDEQKGISHISRIVEISSEMVENPKGMVENVRGMVENATGMVKNATGTEGNSPGKDKSQMEENPLRVGENTTGLVDSELNSCTNLGSHGDIRIRHTGMVENPAGIGQDQRETVETREQFVSNVGKFSRRMEGNIAENQMLGSKETEADLMNIHETRRPDNLSEKLHQVEKTKSKLKPGKLKRKRVHREHPYAKPPPHKTKEDINVQNEPNCSRNQQENLGNAKAEDLKNPEDGQNADDVVWSTFVSEEQSDSKSQEDSKSQQDASDAELQDHAEQDVTATCMADHSASSKRPEAEHQDLPSRSSSFNDDSCPQHCEISDTALEPEQQNPQQILTTMADDAASSKSQDHQQRDLPSQSSPFNDESCPQHIEISNTVLDSEPQIPDPVWPCLVDDWSSAILNENQLDQQEDQEEVKKEPSGVAEQVDNDVTTDSALLIDETSCSETRKEDEESSLEDADRLSVMSPDEQLNDEPADCSIAADSVDPVGSRTETVEPINIVPLDTEEVMNSESVALTSMQPPLISCNMSSICMKVRAAPILPNITCSSTVIVINSAVQQHSVIPSHADKQSIVNCTAKKTATQVNCTAKKTATQVNHTVTKSALSSKNLHTDDTEKELELDRKREEYVKKILGEDTEFFPCEFAGCGQQFLKFSISQYEEHKKTHPPFIETLYCKAKQCRKYFRDELSLKVHKRLLHQHRYLPSQRRKPFETQNRFKCSFKGCSCVFKYVSHRNIHMELRHAGKSSEGSSEGTHQSSLGGNLKVNKLHQPKVLPHRLYQRQEVDGSSMAIDKYGVPDVEADDNCSIENDVDFVASIEDSNENDALVTAKQRKKIVSHPRNKIIHTSFDGWTVKPVLLSERHVSRIADVDAGVKNANKEQGSKQMYQYDKLQYCTFCLREISVKIARHLLAVHKDEPCISKIRKLPKQSKQRSRMLNLLANEGNLKHNIETLRAGEGTIVVARRGSDDLKLEDFIPCDICLTFVHKESHWRHHRACSAKDEQVFQTTCSTDQSESNLRCSLLRGKHLLASALLEDQCVQQVIERLPEDVEEVVRNDALIMRHLTTRLQSLGVQKARAIKQINKEATILGKLLTEARESMPNITLNTLIKAEHFDLVLKSAKEAMIHSDVLPQTQSKKFGNLLAYVAACKIGWAVKTPRSYNYNQQDPVLLEDAGHFLRLLRTSWPSIITADSIKKQTTHDPDLSDVQTTDKVDEETERLPTADEEIPRPGSSNANHDLRDDPSICGSYEDDGEFDEPCTSDVEDNSKDQSESEDDDDDNDDDNDDDEHLSIKDENDEDFDYRSYDDEDNDPDFKLISSDSDDDHYEPPTKVKRFSTKNSKPEVDLQEMFRTISVLDDLSDDSDNDLFDASFDKDNFDESDILRDVNFRDIFVKLVGKCSISKTGRQKKFDRVYNFYHYCPFCKSERKFTNLLKHLLGKHCKEPEVIEINKLHPSAFPNLSAVELKNNKLDRKNKIKILRYRGDHEHNCNVVKKKRGDIVLCRRLTGTHCKTFNISNYGPCKLCKAWLNIDRVHKYCPALPSTGCPKKQKLAVEISNAASPALRTEVLPMLPYDPVGSIARQDLLIVCMGNWMMQRNLEKPEERHSYTEEMMKHLANTIHNLRSRHQVDRKQPSSGAEPTENFMWDYLRPQHFHICVEAAFRSALQYLEDVEELTSPAHAIKFGRVLERLANIKIGIAKKQLDKDTRNETQTFLKLLKNTWQTQVSELAEMYSSGMQQHLQKHLPHPEHLQKLKEFTESELNKFDTDDRSSENFRRAAQLVQAELATYNQICCRELQTLRLDDYSKKQRRMTLEDVEQTREMTKFEVQLLEKEEVILVEMKTGKAEPVIIPQVCAQVLGYLADSETRETAGVNTDNHYVFALNGCGVIPAYDSLAAVCAEVDIPKLSRMTSGDLRRYTATMMQVLHATHSQISWLCGFLDHSMDSQDGLLLRNRLHYDLAEIVKITKKLLVKDNNLMEQYSEKCLDDVDIAELVFPKATSEESSSSHRGPVLDPGNLLDGCDAPLSDEHIPGMMDYIVEDDKNDEDCLVITTNRRFFRRHRPKPRRMHHWSTSEEVELRKIFRKCFITRRCPRIGVLEKAVRYSKRSGGEIWKQSRDNIKKKVNNMILKLNETTFRTPKKPASSETVTKNQIPSISSPVEHDSGGPGTAELGSGLGSDELGSGRLGADGKGSELGPAGKGFDELGPGEKELASVELDSAGKGSDDLSPNGKGSDDLSPTGKGSDQLDSGGEGSVEMESDNQDSTDQGSKEQGTGEMSSEEQGSQGSGDHQGSKELVSPEQGCQDINGSDKLGSGDQTSGDMGSGEQSCSEQVSEEQGSGDKDSWELNSGAQEVDDEDPIQGGESSHIDDDDEYVAELRDSFEDEDSDLDDTLFKVVAPKKKIRRCNRQPWNAVEEEELRKLFRKCFENGTCPRTQMLEDVMEKSERSGGVIWKRPRDNIKKKVNNMVLKLKGFKRKRKSEIDAPT